MSDSTRLRPHPQERFAPIAQVFDLEEAVAQLRAEPHAAVDGHRQMALYRHGSVTVLLFLLEAGARLQYEAPGLVTIHALRGELDVAVQEESHRLGRGQLLTVDPGSALTIHAVPVAAEILVTVHKLEG